MQKLLLLVAVTLAFVSGQYIYPSNATQLSFGTNLLALPPQFNIDYAQIGSFYYVYLPTNVSAVNITISMSSILPASARCRYVDLYASSEGYACTDTDPTESTGSQNYLCNYGPSSYISYASNSGTDGVDTIEPGTEQTGSYYFNTLTFRSGGYLYLTASRDSSNTNDFNRTCPFTISINADFCSGADAINVNSGTSSSSDSQCTTVSDITIPAVGAGLYNETFTARTGLFVRRVTLPAQTGSIHMRINTTVSGYLSISNYQAAYSAAPDSCSTFSSGSSGQYYIDVLCTGLTAGTAYVLFTPSSATTAYSGFLLLDAEYCGASSLTGAGAFCNSTFLNLTSALTAPLSIQFSGDAYGYIDFDITQSTTLFLATNYSLYVYFSRSGGFPDASYPYYYISSGSTIQSFTYLNQDFNTYTGAGPVSGRVYYFFDGSTSSGSGANVTLSATQVATTTTTTTSGSVTSTGATSTGAATSTGSVTGSVTSTTATSTGAATTSTSTSTTGVRMTTSVIGTTGAAPVVATTNSAFTVIPSILIIAALALMF